jgi:hypothetical protein
MGIAAVMAAAFFYLSTNERRIKAMVKERVAAGDLGDDFVSGFIEAGMGIMGALALVHFK